MVTICRWKAYIFASAWDQNNPHFPNIFLANNQDYILTPNSLSIPANICRSWSWRYLYTKHVNNLLGYLYVHISASGFINSLPSLNPPKMGGICFWKIILLWIAHFYFSPCRNETHPYRILFWLLYPQLQTKYTAPYWWTNGTGLPAHAPPQNWCFLRAWHHIHPTRNSESSVWFSTSQVSILILSSDYYKLSSPPFFPPSTVISSY